MSEKYEATDFFPYAHAREGQYDMMRQIEEGARSGLEVCIEAPNGFGKTCVTLCGVLPWIKENEGKVLYCARTHRQLDRVIEELHKISEKQEVTGISFRGRIHMCLNEFLLKNAGEIAPVSEICSHLKSSGKCDFYENLKLAGGPEDLLEDMPFKIMTAPDIVKASRIRGYCPYELAKQLARSVDVVAFSYLYIFDPFILETFVLDLDVPMSRVIVVEDEAHNVPSTALDSASDSLTIGTIRTAMKEATTYNDATSKQFCKALAKYILDTIDKYPDEQIPVNPKEVYKIVASSLKSDSATQPIPHMQKVGKTIQKSLLRAGKAPRSAIHRVGEFMAQWLHFSERDDFTFTVTKQTINKRQRLSLDIIALDPTHVTNKILRTVHSTVAVSGTISPIDAYSEMLGFKKSAIKKRFPSPFARGNRLGLVVMGLDTSLRNRTERTFRRMVDICTTVAHTTPGNTGIFTASYSISRALLKARLEEKLAKPLYIEKQGMTTSQNDKMVEEFKSAAERDGAVLLGVQGGRNSEGGDFPGDTMNSVIVVGVPYARPTHSTKSLIAYYNRRFNGKGQEYAYIMPAMTRAIQAAGRPVRRLEDRGAIILLDQRFATKNLQRFMPLWLKEVTEVVQDDPSQIRDQLEGFFSAWM